MVNNSEGLNGESVWEDARFRQAYSFGRDLAERVLWTAAQAGLAVVVTGTADLPLWLAVPIAAGLSTLKGLVARQLARKGTASTAPGV